MLFAPYPAPSSEKVVGLAVLGTRTELEERVVVFLPVAVIYLL